MGQDLIWAAQMRSLMQQIERYKTAAMTFRDKYDALPGDISNATSFWPADPACGGNGVRPYMAKSDGMTCNGNGDGVINGGYEVEASLFWQHLSLAGLIPGAYTGTCGYTGANCGTNGYYEAVNVDMPPGPFGITGIVIINPDLILTPNSSPGSYWPQGGQHVFWLEGTYSADGSGNAVWNDYGMNLWAMTSAQALAIDTKYDDGNPGTGAITNGGPLTGTGSTSGKEVCMDGTVSPPQYWSAAHSPGGALGSTVPSCDLMFKAGF